MWIHDYIFPNELLQICIISVSGDCMSCIFKFCQIVESESVTIQFHKFSYVIFGGFLQFGPTVSQSLMTLSIGIYDVREEMCATPSSSGFARFFFQVSPPSIDDCYGSSFLSIWHNGAI